MLRAPHKFTMAIWALFGYFGEMNFPIILLIVIGILGFEGNARAQWVCVDATDGLRSMDVASVLIVNDDGIQIPLNTLVANDDFERL